MELPNIHIISEDRVFSTIIHRLLMNKFEGVNYTKNHSFSELQSMPFDKQYDAFLLDNFIAGTAHFELIAYLRNKKDVSAPILYFTNNILEERAALHAGASIVISKPFVPNDFMDQMQLLTTLVK